MEGHGIRYENAAVHWTEALPLGNGTFGAMAYLQDAHMRLSMNHYEVYYSGLPDYSRTAQKTQRHYQKAGGDTKAAYVQRAKAALETGQPPGSVSKGAVSAAGRKTPACGAGRKPAGSGRPSDLLCAANERLGT